MVQIFQFDSGAPGLTLLIFGAIHGDEVCGPIAIQHIQRRIGEGHIPLLKGRLWLVPICNPQAYTEKKRYCEQNLNRVFSKHVSPASYEEELANELIKYVQQADYLLDLHSMPSNGHPFAFLDYEDELSRRFLIAQGLEHVLLGWTDLYSHNGVLQESSTTDYAHSVGTIGLTVECGAHQDAQAVEVAERCILRSLAVLGLIAPLMDHSSHPPLCWMKMTNLIRKAQSGYLVRHFKHLDAVSKGECIAKYEDGSGIHAEQDGFILLPHQEAQVGNEWFYIGKKLV